mmetsp:Transcript_20293/g.17531  ORF Transcript_20293/g.17531 Transcript_20293/m.17531 type:complete len:261 (+) Transcript_20293:1712-2494(+)
MIENEEKKVSNDPTSDRFMKRPFLGNSDADIDMRSPGAAARLNNIKIIDKYEAKDSANKYKDLAGIKKSLSPNHFTSPQEIKFEMDSEEFEVGESLGSTLKDSQALKKKLRELGVESKDYENDEEFEKNMKDLSREMNAAGYDTGSTKFKTGVSESTLNVENKDASNKNNSQQNLNTNNTNESSSPDKDSRRRTSGETDYEVQEDVVDDEIVWEDPSFNQNSAKEQRQQGNEIKIMEQSLGEEPVPAELDNKQEILKQQQ